MKLTVGQRLPGTGPDRQPGGYVVTEVVAETPWYGLYAGKKIFYNYDFTNKRLRETDEAEWLDVYLRTIRYPRVDSAYVHGRRRLARSEVRSVLANRFSNLWPEPIELLEVANGHDPLPSATAATAEDSNGNTEPIVVFARPHGQSLGDWQQTVVPLSSILSVLAELLDFLRRAHAAGLVLQALGPAAILVDASDRIHYIGTDLVLEQTIAEGEIRAELFPTERWPRGFTAPECYESQTEATPRSDLYAWGALAYFLLTGHPPWRIAVEQGRDWAQFQDIHFDRLEQSLAAIPLDHRRNWAEQLGVPERALSDWPHCMVRVFRCLLQTDSSRRPGTVDELLSWIDAPPPPPVNAMLAVMTGPAEAVVCVDLENLVTGLDMLLRRGVGTAPRHPDDGAVLDQGPASKTFKDPAVPLTPEPVFYTAFLRRSTSAGPVFSTGVSAELLPATPAALRQFAESLARTSEFASPAPPALRLSYDALYPLFVCEALIASSEPTVRSWAVTRLKSLLPAKEDSRGSEGAHAERLLWQSLRDPFPALRVEAVHALVENAANPADETLVRMARAMIQGDLEDADDAIQVLRQAGVSAEQAGRVLETLEQDRPLACPECQIQLTRRERAWHLRDVHDYVSVGAGMLPRPQALERLWRDVIDDGNALAHDQLLAAISPGDTNASAYLAGLEAHLGRGNGQLDGSDVATRLKGLTSYAECLRKSARCGMLTPELVCSKNPVVRALGRETAYQLAVCELQGSRIQPRSMRAVLGRLLPGQIEESIALCRRLPQSGIDADLVAGCVKLLESERLTACTECAAPVRVGDLDTHLRRAHGVYQFRGSRGPFNHVRALLLDAAFGPPGDAEAWSTLEELAQDRHAREADRRLVTWVCQRLIQLKRKRRKAAMAGLAAMLASRPAGPRLLSLLARRWKEPAVHILARHVALEVVCRLPAPVSPEIVQTVLPLLSARELSRDVKAAAMEALWKTTGPDGEQANELLQAFVASSGKLRAIDKLRRLEKRVGSAPALDALCARLEDQVRMDCPRCGAQLRRIDMVRHLWEGHRLMLEGRRVREPWHVLEDWVVDYGLEKDARLLERCRDLAGKLDGERGQLRLQQLLLRHGVEDRQALDELSARARASGAAICPHCFELVPTPQSLPPAPLKLDNERLEGAGYSIAFASQGIFPGLLVEGPDGPVYRGREPGRGLSRLGGLLALVLPLVLGMIGLALGPLRTSVPIPVGITLAIGLGLVLAGLLISLWPRTRPARARLIDTAWKLLVPALLAKKWSECEAGFLGRLAVSTRGVGSVDRRGDAVALALVAMESWNREQPGAWASLAALARLAAEDRLERGDDPVLPLVEQAARSLQGKAPLSFAEAMLHDLFADSPPPTWTRGQVRRIQVLLAEAAFAAGLDVPDVADIGRASAVLYSALGCKDLDRLAQLRLLRRFEESRPWQKIAGAAPVAAPVVATVFALARDAHQGPPALGAQADLLLCDRQSGITVGSNGVWLKEVCFTAMPEEVEVRPRGVFGDGFDVIAGPHHFSFPKNPRELAAKLQEWLHFYFRDFVPELGGIHGHPTDAGRRLLAKSTQKCTACRAAFVAGPGQIGLRLD